MAKGKKLSFKEYLKIAKWSLGIGYKYSPRDFIINILTEIALSVRPLLYSYLVAKIIDQAIQLATVEGTEFGTIIKYLLSILVFDLIFALIRNVNRLTGRKLRYFAQIFRIQYEFTKLFALGIQTIQDPEVNKLRENASRWFNLVDELNRELIYIISYTFSLIISAIYIIEIFPILLLVFLAYAIILISEKGYFFRKDFEYQVSDKNTDLKSKNYRIASNITDPNYIEEISIIGSFKFLSERFINFFKEYNDGLIKIFTRERIYGFILNIFNIGIIFSGYVRVFQSLLNGKITVGTTSFHMSIMDTFNRSMNNIVSSIVVSRDFATKLSKVYEFYNLQPNVKDGSIKLPRLNEPPAIEFKNMSFAYPNSKINIFENFNLKINSGEKVAIVGVNGAGKSTMTKLIARLYDPQSGQILVNGKDLKDLKIDDWYKNMGLLFQDFKIYDMLTVKENIYIGKTAKPIDEEKVIEAAQNADVDDFVDRYPLKYDTFLSERYENGIQPSKGQKQKIAIARFFYRDAPLAIFDEPTSAIDAQSEYKIFNRIYDFFDNKTVIIISHRFSTVRNADRIIVLDDGGIVEEGSHSDLIKLNGKYAEAFKLQADGYKD